MMRDGLLADAREGRWRRWAGIGLFLLAVVVFGVSVKNGFIWDDDRHVTGNGALRTAAGLWRLWFERGATPQYYPLVFTIFWGEFHAWGLWAAGYHAVNVLVHATNAVLLWRVLRRLGLGERAALLGAALWAVHPVQVETVDWVMEQKNLFSTLFYLLSARELLKLWGFAADERCVATPLNGDTGGAGVLRWRGYALALLLFVAALLTKSVTATLPAAFLVVLWWRRGRIGGRDVLLMLPFFVIGAVSGVWTAIMEQTVVGAGGPEWALTGAQRLLLAGRTAAFYAGKLAWPWRLTFFYEHWEVRPGEWWQWLFPAGVVAVLVLLVALHRRIGRGPAAAGLFFVGTLFPALGFFNVYPFRYSYVADHFQYVACAGLLTLLAAGIAKLPRAACVGIGTVLIVVLGVRAGARCLAFRDGPTLYKDVIAQDAHSWVGHGLLANQEELAGQPELAARDYAAATQLAPEITENFEGLANTYMTRGQPEEAQRMLQALLEKPGLTGHQQALIYNDLAGVQVRLGAGAEAMENYRRAIELFPQGSFMPRYNLGRMLADQGKLAEAEEQFAGAIALVPERSDAQLAMGLCLAQEHRVAEALPYFERAAEYDPNSQEAALMAARARAVLGR